MNPFHQFPLLPILYDLPAEVSVGTLESFDVLVAELEFSPELSHKPLRNRKSAITNRTVVETILIALILPIIH